MDGQDEQDGEKMISDLRFEISNSLSCPSCPSMLIAFIA
jgi:hypothetical protein